MANINLLPWREKLREERKKQFFITLGIAAGFAGVILGIGHLYIKGSIANQNARQVQGGTQPSNEQLINEQRAAKAVLLARDELKAAMSRRNP